MRKKNDSRKPHQIRKSGGKMGFSYLSANIKAKNEKTTYKGSFRWFFALKQAKNVRKSHKGAYQNWLPLPTDIYGNNIEYSGAFEHEHDQEIYPCYRLPDLKRYAENCR